MYINVIWNWSILINKTTDTVGTGVTMTFRGVKFIALR